MFKVNYSDLLCFSAFDNCFRKQLKLNRLSEKTAENFKHKRLI